MRVSRPHYRYLCLHFLFCTLQHTSQYTFNANRMLPYRSLLLQDPIASVDSLCPIIIHAGPLD
nr:hypothetical protein [uncultured bacterium]AOE07908.1 hypothetical protein [uncultured bacterium]